MCVKFCIFHWKRYMKYFGNYYFGGFKTFNNTFACTLLNLHNFMTLFWPFCYIRENKWKFTPCENNPLYGCAMWHHKQTGKSTNVKVVLIRSKVLPDSDVEEVELVAVLHSLILLSCGTRYWPSIKLSKRRCKNRCSLFNWSFCWLYFFSLSSRF